MAKAFIVHRIERYVFEDILPTAHQFSDPLPRAEAEALAVEWADPDLIVRETAISKEHPLHSVEVTIDPFKKRTDYNDGKTRRVTVEGQRYLWFVDTEQVVHVSRNDIEVLAFTADPDGRTPHGVRRMLRVSLPSPTP
jgi:hypothetical protein